MAVAPELQGELEGRIGYRFRERTLLDEALTHRSALNESAERRRQDNERLEFLGDAVLGLMVASLLLERFPLKREGELSRLRASLVGEAPLATLARSLELGKFLVMGKGERLTGGADRTSILADAFEALLAAVYLDGGSDAATRLVKELFSPLLPAEAFHTVGRDYKTALQELAQARFGEVPEYRLDAVTGPPHDRQFTISVILHHETLGEGEGGSKKEAAQAAAQVALLRLSQ